MSVNLARGYDPTLALTGGHWVTVRGIRRWVGKRPADEPDPALTIVTENETRVCLSCEAGPTETCVNGRGEACSPHKMRLVARQCQCGETAMLRQLTCRTCMDAAIAKREGVAA